MLKFLRKGVGLLLGIALLGACTVKNAVLHPHGPDRVEIRDRYVVMLLLDGARPQELESQVKLGKLPHFQKLFFTEGLRFENALTVFPPLSNPAHQAFLSGLYPGHNGIPSLDWFSRPAQRHFDFLSPHWMARTNALFFNYLQVQRENIQGDAPQLLFDALRGHPTLAAMESANYGHTHRVGNNRLLHAGWKAYMQRSFEALDFTAMNFTLKKFRDLPLEEFPRFSMIDLYGLDFIAHYNGPASSRSLNLYQHIDRFLGELVQTLKHRGLWEKTLLVVVSDHGQHELQGTVDLPQLLQHAGFTIVRDHPENGEVVWGDHGTGFSNLYFKWGKSWQQTPSYSELRRFPRQDGQTVDLIEIFRSQPDIEIVLAPEGPTKTHLFFRESHAIIERRYEGTTVRYAYLPDPGQDPLNYKMNPTLKQWIDDGSFQDAENWLRESAHLPLPDSIVALPQLFDDGRSGDLVLLTVPHKQFKKNFVAGHGSLLREDRRVLWLMHGPDIRPGAYPHARTVDMAPTLLAFWGLSPQGPMDGVLRDEIFSENFRATLGNLKNLKPSSPGMTVAEFKKFIEDRLNSKQLNAEETLKAQQILFSLEHYLSGTEPKSNAQPRAAQ